MKLKLLLAVFAMGMICGGCSLFSGNSQSTVTTAYKSEYAADAAVTTAMTAWGAYVAAYHPSVSQEQQVQTAFNDYKAANLAAISATEAYANATGSNSVATVQSVQAASTQAAQALSQLLGLVTQLTTQTNQLAK